MTTSNGRQLDVRARNEGEWGNKLRAKPIGDYAMDVKARELIARHDLFYRYASQSLGAVAVRESVGSYTKAIEALAEKIGALLVTTGAAHHQILFAQIFRHQILGRKLMRANVIALTDESATL